MQPITLSLSLIAAVADNNVIGRDNQMPWHLPADLRYFREKTTGNIVVMGRKTYDAIGKPLPDRVNIVFTSDNTITGVEAVNSKEAFYELLRRNRQDYQGKEIFIIGGAALFKMFLPEATTIYLTRIYKQIEGDTFFPEIDKQEWMPVAREKGIRDDENDYDYEFLIFKRKRKDKPSG